MEKSIESIFAFVRYEGEFVKDGYLDARKSGEVLIGIDELMRHFIYQENPLIKDFDFDIPVRIRKGSWETIFSDNTDFFIKTGMTLVAWMAAKYAGTALSEIAKNDFKDVSFVEVCRKALKNAISVIKLSKHLGTISKKRFDKVTFANNNELVKITNENGEDLWIPIEVLEIYTNCPQNIFKRLAKIIEKERELVIGVIEQGKSITENISYLNKSIFSKSDDEDEVVLPELKHGMYVELNGRITRGNEKTNTIGFLYEGHILTCTPVNGNIKQHKSKMFSNCIIKGSVNRMDRDGNNIEKRPRINFDDAINLDKPELKLFD